MKLMKIPFLAVCAMALLSLTGCGGAGNTPDAIALDFMERVKTDTVKEYHDKACAATWKEKIDKVKGENYQKLRANAKEELKDARFSVEALKMRGTTATVTVKIENMHKKVKKMVGKEEKEVDELKDGKETFDFAQYDGEWKIVPCSNWEYEPEKK